MSSRTSSHREILNFNHFMVVMRDIIGEKLCDMPMTGIAAENDCLNNNPFEVRNAIFGCVSR